MYAPSVPSTTSRPMRAFYSSLEPHPQNCDAGRSSRRSSSPRSPFFRATGSSSEGAEARELLAKHAPSPLRDDAASMTNAELFTCVSAMCADIRSRCLYSVQSVESLGIIRQKEHEFFTTTLQLCDLDLSTRTLAGNTLECERIERGFHEEIHALRPRIIALEALIAETAERLSAEPSDHSRSGARRRAAADASTETASSQGAAVNASSQTSPRRSVAAAAGVGSDAACQCDAAPRVDDGLLFPAESRTFSSPTAVVAGGSSPGPLRLDISGTIFEHSTSDTSPAPCVSASPAEQGMSGLMSSRRSAPTESVLTAVSGAAADFTSHELQEARSRVMRTLSQQDLLHPSMSFRDCSTAAQRAGTCIAALGESSGDELALLGGGGRGTHPTRPTPATPPQPQAVRPDPVDSNVFASSPSDLVSRTQQSRGPSADVHELSHTQQHRDKATSGAGQCVSCTPITGRPGTVVLDSYMAEQMLALVDAHADLEHMYAEKCRETEALKRVIHQHGHHIRHQEAMLEQQRAVLHGLRHGTESQSPLRADT